MMPIRDRIFAAGILTALIILILELQRVADALESLVMQNVSSDFRVSDNTVEALRQTSSLAGHGETFASDNSSTRAQSSEDNPSTGSGQAQASEPMTPLLA